MLVSECKNFIYYSAPKSASTTMRNRLKQYQSESFLQRYFDLDESEDYKNLLIGGGMQYIPLLNAIICPMHMTHEQFNRFPEAEHYSNYFKFTFVRNPYDRFYSSYQEAKTTHLRRFHENDALRQKVERVGFSTFALEEIDINRIRFDHRFCNFIPQHYYAYAGEQKAVQFCGHNEIFDSDYQTLCNTLDLEPVQVDANVRGELKQCANINDTAGYKYLSMYIMETIQLVNVLYERDFTDFGYQMLDPTDFPAVP